MEKGIKHLIRCRCFLPQFKGQPDPPQHQFVVFSVFDVEGDALKVKFAQCNNCGTIHKVIDLCKSEIMPGRENLSSILTLEDIKTGLPSKLVAILETNQSDYASFEQAKWILETQQWGDFIVLSSDTVEGMRQGKYIRIISEQLYSVDSFTRDEVVNVGDKK